MAWYNIFAWAGLLFFFPALPASFANTGALPLHSEEEEVPIAVSVYRHGYYEVNALVSDDQVKLPVKRLVGLLGIAGSEAPSGALLIAWPGKKVAVQLSPSGNLLCTAGEIRLGPEDFRYVDGEFFLAHHLWDTVFGVKAVFSFQQLSVQLEGDFGAGTGHGGGLLPALPDRPPADLVIGPSRAWISGGALDYQLNYRVQGRAEWAEARLLAGGGLLGGNAQALLHLQSPGRFEWGRQQFQWTYRAGQGRLFRQVQAGHIGSRTIIRNWRPLIGLLVNNFPDTAQAGKWTYQFQTGYLPRLRGGWFTRPELAVLISPGFSAGAGLEHHTELNSSRPFWWVQSRFALARGFSAQIEHAHGVRTLFHLSGSLFNSITLRYALEDYRLGQEVALFVPYLERQQLELGAHYRLFGAFAGTVFDAEWQRGEHFAQGTAQVLFSLLWKRCVIQAAVRYVWLPIFPDELVSMLRVEHRVGRFGTLRLESQFLGMGLRVYGLEAEWVGRIARNIELVAGYREGFQRGRGTFGVQLAVQLGAVRSFSALSAGGGQGAYAQGISGSLFYDAGRGAVVADAQPVAGVGGLTLLPFVDVNHNYRRDPGEPAAPGLIAALEGRPQVQALQDTVINIHRLAGGRDYLLQLEEHGFEDIFWGLRYKAILVRAEPHQYRHIEIPVLPMHEIFGTVSPRIAAGQRPPDKIFLFGMDGRFLRHTLPAPDGRYAFSGLPPGRYFLGLEKDPESPGTRQIEIPPAREGRQIGPLDW
jgi:hypothetical protein